MNETFNPKNVFGNESEEVILVEGKRQLGGIIILLWILIGLLSIAFLVVLFSVNFNSRLDLIALNLFFFGGLLTLFIFAQLGIKNQKPYTVPLIRIILVLWCFNLVGLIVVLTIFWKRINPYSKKYLNYFDGTFEMNAKKETKVIGKKTSKSIYCINCGTESSFEVSFCTNCGKKILSKS